MEAMIFGQALEKFMVRDIGSNFDLSGLFGRQLRHPLRRACHLPSVLHPRNRGRAFVWPFQDPTPGPMARAAAQGKARTPQLIGEGLHWKSTNRE